MKSCSRCKSIKQACDFRKKKSGKLTPQCIDCIRLSSKESRIRCNAQQNSKLLWKLKAREFVHSCKTKPCTDCGVLYPHYVMHFDHLPGTKKLFNIGSSIGVHSIEKIKEEMAKCELVCANCHSVRTWNRDSSRK